MKGSKQVVKQVFHIAVPAEYFFHRVIELVLYDIYQQTGKKIKPQELKGFSFNRKNSTGFISKMTIIDYQPNKIYAYLNHTRYNRYKVVYQIEPIGNQRMRLLYRETIKGYGGFNKDYNIFKPITVFLRKRYFKKIKKQLEADYIQQESHKS